eukprot:gene2769-biopygen3957
MIAEVKQPQKTDEDEDNRRRRLRLCWRSVTFCDQDPAFCVRLRSRSAVICVQEPAFCFQDPAFCVQLRSRSAPFAFSCVLRTNLLGALTKGFLCQFLVGTTQLSAHCTFARCTPSQCASAHARPDRIGSDRVGSDPFRSNQIRSDPSRSGQIRANPLRLDQIHTYAEARGATNRTQNTLNPQAKRKQNTGKGGARRLKSNQRKKAGAPEGAARGNRIVFESCSRRLRLLGDAGDLGAARPPSRPRWETPIYGGWDGGGARPLAALRGGSAREGTGAPPAAAAWGCMCAQSEGGRERGRCARERRRARGGGAPLHRTTLWAGRADGGGPAARERALPGRPALYSVAARGAHE